MLGKIFAPAVVRRAMLSKSLIQVSADGWVCVPSSKVTQSWNAQASKCTRKVTPKRTYANTHLPHCCCQHPCPYRRPLLTHASTGDPQTLTGSLVQSLVGSLLLSPESWCA